MAGLPPHQAEQHLPCGHTRALAATGRGLAIECTHQTERASSQITANSRTDGHSHRPFTGARMSTRSSALHVIGRAHLCQHRLALCALNYGRGRARFMRLRVAFLARFLPGSLSFPPPDVCEHIRKAGTPPSVRSCQLASYSIVSESPYEVLSFTQVVRLSILLGRVGENQTESRTYESVPVRNVELPQAPRAQAPRAPNVKQTLQRGLSLSGCRASARLPTPPERAAGRAQVTGQK